MGWVTCLKCNVAVQDRLLCKTCHEEDISLFEAIKTTLDEKIGKDSDMEKSVDNTDVEQILEVHDEMQAECVNHPKHYNHGKFEAIDVIEDWELGFHLGNVVKYISRAGKKDKNTELQDLKKALWYMERKIENLENDNG